MADLDKNARLIYIKGCLFLLIGLLTAGLLLLENWHWKTAALLCLCIWSFARFYYFAFYVIEHYVDGEYRFSGLVSFVQYVCSRSRDSE